MKHHLTIAPAFAALVPHYTMGMIEAKVVNSSYDFEFQREIDRAKGAVALSCKLDDVKRIPAIYYTREAYKRLGKDPNRYRPAAEQLRRRLLKGLGLYTINTLVDFGNLVSLETGFSIGVFDAPRVLPEVLIRRGAAEDIFEGIGRGTLNVDGLPLFVDANGPFASPTSDSERTKVHNATSEALIFINNYIPSEKGGTELLEDAISLTCRLMEHYLKASDIEIAYFSTK